MNAKGAVSADRLYYETTSMCPSCGELVPGRVVARNGGVYVDRECPAHGPFAGLACSDVDWYDELPRYDVTPVKPSDSQSASLLGCPRDCGLCPAHRQIAGTAAVEISNHCNAACPVCLADNRGTFELSPEEVSAMADDLLRRQGTIDAFTLSGGEPTIHPKIFEIIRTLERPGISRIVLNTNGRRVAEDDAFLDELSRHPRVYVSLHFDGRGASVIRGVDFSLQRKALDRLLRRGIPVVPLILAATGVNERDLGGLATSLLLESPAIKCVILSLMAYTGRGATFPGAPGDRLTIPAALDAMEAGEASRLRRRDFMPLPMPNPLCAAIGYFLVQDASLIPLVPLLERDRMIEYIANAHFARADERLEAIFREMVDRVYSRPDEFDDPRGILDSCRRLLDRLYPSDRRITPEERQAFAEERIKTVYLMQFMDAWTFDSRRLQKCSCQHLLPGGRVVPSCGYYAYHRRSDPRFGEGKRA